MQVTALTGPFALQEMPVCYTQTPPYSRWHAMTLVGNCGSHEADVMYCDHARALDHVT